MHNDIKILIDDVNLIINLFGKYDENVKLIEQTFNVKVVNRNDEIKITGEGNRELAADVITKLLDIAQKGERVTLQSVNYIIGLVMDDNPLDINKLLEDTVIVTARGKYVKCKTLGQKTYIDSIKNNDIVFGIGPAGTGKTYLAIAMAVKALKEKKVTRIVLTRPAVEAGEKLGFLPGDLQEKINPYLRPLYDSLYDILGMDTFQRYVESNIIEIAPLAYMRGRTLDDCFIILDEAQNTTSEQMKMFLTRLGYGSKAIITGDLTQTDLAPGKKSGLHEAVKVLKGIKGIDFVNLTFKDVVRHKLVMDIIKAYDKFYHEKEIGD